MPSKRRESGKEVMHVVIILYIVYVERYTPSNVPTAHPNIGRIRLSFWSDIASKIAERAMVTA
jgi:hypothetical protein